MLKIENVTAGYHKATVISDVSLDIREGECDCLVGANGAGKSTLMRVITGLLKPFSGRVTYEGTVLTDLSPDKIVDLGIILVPEGRQLFPKMTVLENLLLGGRSKRANPDSKSSFEMVYRLFPVLEQRKSQLAGTLSGGEQQMLAVGRGLMANPNILLLDEPSIGLGPKLVTEIFDVIKVLEKENIGVFLVEQNVRASLTISSRGYLLERGQMVLSGEADKLLKDDAIRKGYLGG